MTELVFLAAQAAGGTDAAAGLRPGPGAGDGVFETIRIHNGQLMLWAAHLKRLLNGLQRLLLNPGLDFSEQLRAHAESVAESRADGILRIVVTAEAEEGGYRRRDPVRLLISLQTRKAPEVPATWYEQGVAVTVCQQRLAGPAGLAGIKHLNRIEQILATRELADVDAQEGLMLDLAGNVIEGTRTNVFLRDAAGWHTPDLSACGVQGTLRDALLPGLAAAGEDVAVAVIPQSALAGVQEMFLCNSVSGVWPVRWLDGRSLDVGPGTRLAQCLAQQMLEPGAP